MQRVGRSGDGLGATRKGRLLAMSLDDLIDCAAAVRAIRAGRLDEVEIPTGCIDVVAQQVVAIAAEEGEAGVGEHELLTILRSAYNFADLDEDEFRKLLKQMASELNERIYGAAPKIFYDQRRGRITAKRGARMAA